jgi:hypothetical protein
MLSIKEFYVKCVHVISSVFLNSGVSDLMCGGCDDVQSVSVGKMA